MNTNEAQRRIEQRFSNIANMDHRDDPSSELIGLMRDLFEYVKDVDERLIARGED